jgi:hypothetical protein
MSAREKSGQLRGQDQLEMGRHMNKTKWLTAALLLCMTPMASASVAIVSDGVNSTEHLGSFAAQLTYAVVDATHASLQVAITNTSPVENGGKLVAFLFNNPGNKITGVTRSTTTGLQTLLGGGTFNNTIKASPFADFDIGISLGGNNNNGFTGAGGSPTPGIGVGQTGNFTFNFAGTGLDQLNEASFLNAKNANGYFFAARFKGFADGGSDKVPGTLVVPEPASLAVWGCIGLMGIPYGIYRGRKAREA